MRSTEGSEVDGGPRSLCDEIYDGERVVLAVSVVGDVREGAIH
jgi:hypothetical protein